MEYRERRSNVPGITVWTRGSGGSPGWVLPDGCIDVIWDGQRLHVTGPDTEPHRPFGSAGGYTAVRFDAGVGPAVLDAPAHALRDQRLALHDLIPPAEAERLSTELAASHNPAETLERWAAGRLAAGSVDPSMQRVVEMLDTGAPVADVANSIGIGERQLHRRSLIAFGYAPKVLARILRFQRALRSPHRRTDLARVAAEAGYADQSHLSREVRALTGQCPSDLFKK